jgi:hypothetical protein
LTEAQRILRPNGLMYASYGPIWFGPSGDHFSLRGGISQAYNHLLLEASQYQQFFEAHLKENENVQDGGRYVPLDLFSKLSSTGYLELFVTMNWKVESIAMQIALQAIEFRDQYPAQWHQLFERYPGLLPDDFLITAHFTFLRKQQ